MTRSRRYSLELVAGFTAYGLGIVALNQLYSGAMNEYWLALLPVVPILYLATVMVRFISELDELQRKIVTEAAAFAALATGFTCFTYLFMRDLGAPEFQGEWAFYLMWGYYGVGMMWSRTRY